jgi:hypothetical protein
MERHRLVTRLNPEECRDRLSLLLATQQGQWRLTGGPPPGRPLDGAVTEDGFTVARFSTGRQSFKTFASGRLVPTPHGTEVTIRLGVHPIVLGFLAVLALLVLSFVLLSLVGIALRTPNQPQERLNPVPLMMLGVLAAMVAIGRYMARNDRAYLLSVLRETLDAEPPPPTELR